jgi:hypothetical protein
MRHDSWVHGFMVCTTMHACNRSLPLVNAGALANFLTRFMHRVTALTSSDDGRPHLPHVRFLLSPLGRARTRYRALGPSASTPTAASSAACPRLDQAFMTLCGMVPPERARVLKTCNNANHHLHSTGRGAPCAQDQARKLSGGQVDPFGRDRSAPRREPHFTPAHSKKHSRELEAVQTKLGRRTHHLT